MPILQCQCFCESAINWNNVITKTHPDSTCCNREIARKDKDTANYLLIHVFCTRYEPETVLPVLQIRTKTILCSLFVQNKQINKKSVVKFWLNSRNYGSVSYSFIFTRKYKLRVILIFLEKTPCIL